MSGKPLLITLFAAWIVFPPAFAQEKPAEKPSDKPAQQSAEKSTEKSAQSTQDFSKEAYIIERFATRVVAENDGTGMREATAQIKMLADAGVKAFAVLNFTYTSANEAVEIDYVRVRKPDGTVVKTPDYNIQDMPGEVTRTAPLYSDIHEKHIAVKGLGVGDELEYLVRFRVLKPEVPGQFWHEYSFLKDAIAQNEELEISLPADKFVKVVSPEFKPEIKTEGGRRIYRWTHQNLIVKEKDPDLPPRRVPSNPDVQVTTFASWEDVGRWYGGLQKDPLAVTPAIQAKADELTKGLKTDDEKIHAIYNFVALKFHYIGLDFGIGRYQPHAADDVLDNGYGDCKDKHTLLASLLKASGIEAWPALIHANRKLDPEVPSPAQFNHVITVVPLAGSYIWLDTTPEVAPYRLLMPLLRDKQALVIPSDKPPQLMTTPANPPFPSDQEFSIKGKLNGAGKFTGHVEQSYRGDTEVFLRSTFRQLSESQWKDMMQRFSYALNFGGEVSNVKVSPPDEIDKPLEISYDYVREKYGSWDDRQITAPLPPMGLEVAKDAHDKKPEEPVLLGAVGKIVYRAQMELPEGYTIQTPSPIHLSEPYAEYDDTPKLENNVLTTMRTLVIKKTEVSLADWQEYRKFGRSLYDDEFNFLKLNGSSATVMAGDEDAGEDENLSVDDMFSEGSSALQRRDFRRAQQLNEKVIAKDPKYKGAHFNLGAALLAQAKLDEALKEFRKEQEISPTDARSYQIPAIYLLQMGRNDDAIEEWRHLQKADPSNRMAASALGVLLDQQEKYTEEVAVLEPVVKAQPDNLDLLMQLSTAYIKVGQNDKGVAGFEKVTEKKGDVPSFLNNAAWTLAENKTNLDLARQYGEKAVDKLQEQMEDAESSQELRATIHDRGLRATYELSLVWDTLGWVYFQQGDLKRAETLVRPAWLLGEHELVGEHLGEIYEKEGKTKDAARMYELSLAAMAPPHGKMEGFSPSDRIKAYDKRSGEVKARYVKLTGKKPSNEIRRLPNGQWTLTSEQELRLEHEIKLVSDKKIAGAATFMVTLKPGKTVSVEYMSGDDDLKALEIKLKEAHYPLEFPPGSTAILTLQTDVRCWASNSCTATLADPSPSTPLNPMSQ
jgi:tetratricopeptide (TPR) repeat protein/transglutaminase-like putative cysteine protease